jgi:mycofactocin precursor
MATYPACDAIVGSFYAGGRFIALSAIIVSENTRLRRRITMKARTEHQDQAELTTEDLIEEVSIDGMCGVY